jgi:AraC-like DNA-binding protein
MSSSAGNRASRFHSEAPPTIPERARWENITVEYHRRQPPGICQPYFQQHRIRIALQEVVLERRVDSGPLIHNALRPGDLIISPANSQEWLRRDEYEDFLVLYLEPVLLTQIAVQLGFYDQSHFTRTFKRVVGVPPHTFLREHGKNIPG